MTRQLIICSALIASVTGPALAVTNAAAIHSAAAIRTIPVDPCRLVRSTADCFRRVNPAVPVPAVPVKDTTDLGKITRPVAWQWHIPVDVVTRAIAPTAAIAITRAATDKGQFARPVVITGQAADLQGRLHGFACPVAEAVRAADEGACALMPASFVRGIHPLFVDDRKFRRTPFPADALPFVLRDPPQSLHRLGAQDRMGQDLRKVTIHRQPAYSHDFSLLLHLGDTPTVNAGIDNQ